jgi:hypothetical protein
MEKSAICRRRWQLLILLLGSLGTAAASSPLTYLGSVLDSVMLSKPEFRKNTAHHHRALEFGKYILSTQPSDILLTDENSHNLFNIDK